ncbi:unnamed protein product [Urochloa decumbens]|uniref:Protein yippee-like n=1 Tax=Urochloa decumbens TaxID=240449 RepID=A0ABC8YKF5_9POAL
MENAAAAAVNTVTEMASRLTIDANNAHPLELDDAGGNVYRCKGCRTHLASADDIISKDFLGEYGRAYLFDKVVNVTVGETEDRMMMTGRHSVSDIFCIGCGVLVGFRYEAAQQRSQKYKEGKFILERYQLLGPKSRNNQVPKGAECG